MSPYKEPVIIVRF